MNSSTPELVELAITVRLPWAELIRRGVKRVENRGRRVHPSHVGKLVAIHVGSTVDVVADPRVVRALPHGVTPTMLACRGAIVAVARITGCHQANHGDPDVTCCPPWGERLYQPSGIPAQHIGLVDVVALGTPVGGVRGALPVPWRLGFDLGIRVTAEYQRSAR